MGEQKLKTYRSRDQKEEISLHVLGVNVSKLHILADTSRLRVSKLVLMVPAQVLQEATTTT